MSGIYNTGLSGLDSIATSTTNFTNKMLLNSSIIFVVALIIIVYILLNPSSTSSSYDSSYSNENSGSFGSIISILITLIVAILVFTILIKVLFGVDIIKYFYNVDIYVMIYELIYGPPPAPIELPKFQAPDFRIKEQVFNIPENTYVYEDAKALCKAYGARLATYNEVEESYSHGGEWCNYGWSDGQMILFPTQQKSYDHLQKIKGHENDCGRPGVNGGYIANPKLKFGVNCFGKKPRMSETEEELMATQPAYPRTQADIELEEKVAYWKDQLSSVLVSPFNHKMWSRY
jgi:hypothetical protein